jgi:hypothetical protein
MIDCFTVLGRSRIDDGMGVGTEPINRFILHRISLATQRVVMGNAKHHFLERRSF